MLEGSQNQKEGSGSWKQKAYVKEKGQVYEYEKNEGGE